MQVTFTFRNVEAGDLLKEYTTKKLSKLDRYIDKPADAHIVLSVEKFRNVAEINLTSSGISLKGKEEAKEMAQAIDTVVDKIERQLKKHKDKIHNYKDASSIQEMLSPRRGGESTEQTLGQQPQVVEMKKVVLEPMSLEDAVLELGSTTDQFMIYRDASTENVCVIYRRDDGNYAMIEARS